jgi:hypothetical protein
MLSILLLLFLFFLADQFFVGQRSLPARARPLAKHREADGPCMAGG